MPERLSLELICRRPPWIWQAGISQNGLKADLHVMNGECMQFPDNSFDVVYAHGVLQYTADTGKMIAEIHRVLKPGGEAIMMVYNRHFMAQPDAESDQRSTGA